MFTNLFVKTNYSLLKSLISLDDLFAYAKENNLKTLAICDENLIASYDFYKRCISNNIKPLIGLNKKIDNLDILIYAKNYEGFKDLIKLDLITHLNENDLNSDNIFVFVPNYNHFNNKKFIKYTNNEKETSNNLIYINKTLYLNKDDEKYLKYLNIIRESNNKNIIIKDNPLFINNQLPIFQNIKYIENNINIVFEKENDLLPKFSDNSVQILIDKVKNNLKIKNITDEEYLKRAEDELKVIIKMGYADYFLIVEDFIKYAQSKNILVGIRGSAGGSLVCYLLGITKIDPLFYDLYFERFLNEERITLPDIDIDFPDIYRDDIIKYVIEKYGIKRVCGIMTLSLLGARQVIRDVAKALNINNNYINKIIKEIPKDTKLSLKDLVKENKVLKSLLNTNDDLRKLLDISLRLENFPRHTSSHAAGIIISNKNLDEVVPLSYDGNHYLANYNMENLEEIGLLKIDFLGLKNLTTIMNIIKSINNDLNLNIKYDEIPLNDSNTYNLFRNADTLGIFQFESYGMRKFLKELKPDNFHEISLAIALFRPGPAENIPLYIKRKEKKEIINYLDDSLKDILEETRGIIVYQEQIMMILRKYASFSLGKADIVRRAMSKKKKDLMAKLKDDFINGALLNGHTTEKASVLFDKIALFADYGFNKSHSVAYSIMAYKMAYLKANFEYYFYKELLNSSLTNKDKLKEYLDEASSRGIKFVLPNIETSKAEFIIKDNILVFPLSIIKGISKKTAEIISDRQQFTDIFDLVTFMLSKDIPKSVIESLNKAACFKKYINVKTFEDNKSKIFNYADIVKDVDTHLITKPYIEEVKEYTLQELLSFEEELYGFYLSSHPSSPYKKKYKCVSTNDLKIHFNQVVNVIGIVKNLKKIKTKNAKDMAFITLEDDKGEVDVTFFESTMEFLPNVKDIVVIEARVQKRYDKYQLIAKRVKILL